MSEDLSTLPPEDFVRLAVERGGLDLDAVTRDLSPEAADALRLIAAPPPVSSSRDIARAVPTRGASRSASSRAPGPSRHAGQEHCPSCGGTLHRDTRYCTHCGHKLKQFAPALTLDDLVAQNRLTPEQARKLKETIAYHQSHYAAGTRYSVFGANP